MLDRPPSSSRARMRSDIQGLEKPLLTIHLLLVACLSSLMVGQWRTDNSKAVERYRRYHGQDDAPVLLWRAPTRTMNPTFPQATIDIAMERDAAFIRRIKQSDNDPRIRVLSGTVNLLRLDPVGAAGTLFLFAASR